MPDCIFLVFPHCHLGGHNHNATHYACRQRNGHIPTYCDRRSVSTRLSASNFGCVRQHEYKFRHNRSSFDHFELGNRTCYGRLLKNRQNYLLKLLFLLKHNLSCRLRVIEGANALRIHSVKMALLSAFP